MPPSFKDFMGHQSLEERLKEKGIKVEPSRVITPEGIFVYSHKNKTSKELKKEFLEKIAKLKLIEMSHLSIKEIIWN
jgi:hypothetical protein